jgi:hypothetical protein
MAKAIVEESVGLAKGHLEMLEELKSPPPATNGVASLAVHTPSHA